MFSSVCMFVLAIFSGCYFLVSAGNIKVEANPKEINFYTTKTFTVNCTYEPATANNNDAYLISLVLSRLSSSGLTTPEELASVDGKSPLHILTPKPNQGITYRGDAQETGPSYLSGQWSQVSADLVGIYICEANVMDDVGHIVTFSSQANVLEDSNSLRAFLEEVKHIQNDLESQQACCINVSAQIAEIQAWKKSVLLGLGFLEKAFLMQRPSPRYENSTYYLSKYMCDDADSAQAVCETMGGYLAEVYDKDEWQFISSYMNNNTVNLAYIGGRDNLTEGRWYWPKSQQTISFTAWTVAQPDNAGNDEDCLEILKVGAKWFWNDIACQSFRRDYFLCEVPVAGP